MPKFSISYTYYSIHGQHKIKYREGVGSPLGQECTIPVLKEGVAVDCATARARDPYPAAPVVADKIAGHCGRRQRWLCGWCPTSQKLDDGNPFTKYTVLGAKIKTCASLW